MKKIRYKLVMSIFLGLLGFVINFSPLDFEFPPHRVSFLMGLFFPMLVTLAWGWRYGLLSGTLGLACQNGWWLWVPTTGWPPLVSIIGSVLWVVWHGWWGERREKKKTFLNNMYVIDIPFELFMVLLFYTLFRWLFQFNPPPFAPESSNFAPLLFTHIVTLKIVTNAWVVLLLADVALHINPVRKLMKLEPFQSQTDTHYIISAALLAGCVFWVIEAFFTHRFFPHGEETLLETLVTNIPSHSLFIRFVFLVLSFVGGLVFSNLLRKQRESEARYRLLAENASDMISRHTPEGVYLYASPACRALLGYEPEELIGQHSYDFFHPDDVEAIRTSHTTILEQPVTYTVSWRVRCKDGTYRWVETTSRTLYDPTTGAVREIIAMTRDISERKRAEEALKEHYEHLEQLVAQRTSELTKATERAEAALRASEAANRAKSEFLANMSHELRTPLNAILGFSNLMAREHGLTTSQRENLEVINRSGEHLLTLINDILDMSKIEAGQSGLDVSNVDLDHSLTGIEDMLRLRAEQKGLEFAVKRAPDLPRYIRTDERKLRQVLINLLGNAIKFTEKGSVTLCIKKLDTRNLIREQQDSASTSKVSQFPVSSLQFQIEDSGIGIASEELEHIFDPFVQTVGSQKVSEGTGLGLTISRQFVQLMGGELTATSQPGQGSVFTFTIQAEAVEAAQVEDRHRPGRVVGLMPDQHAPDGGPYRILIVEDKEFNRMLLQRLLQTIGSLKDGTPGFNVQTAMNGREALDMTAQWHPHLIFMDMRMPVMNGYTATREIRKPDTQEWALGSGRSGVDAGSSVLGAENTGPQGRDSQPSEPRTENPAPSPQPLTSMGFCIVPGTGAGIPLLGGVGVGCRHWRQHPGRNPPLAPPRGELVASCDMGIRKPILVRPPAPSHHCPDSQRI